MCPPQKKHHRTNCADPSWKLILLSKVLVGSKIIHHWHLQLTQLTPGHPWQWRHFCAQRRVKYTRPRWTWRWMTMDWRKRSVSDPVKLKLFVSVGWVFFWWSHTRKLTWQWKLIIFDRRYIFKMGWFFHCHVSLNSWCWGCEGLSGFPTKNVAIMLVTVTRSKIEGLRAFSAKIVTLWKISMISPRIQMRRDRWLSLSEILRRTLQQLKRTVCDFTSRSMWLRKPIYLSKTDAYTQRGMEYTRIFHLSWICLHHHLG